MGAAWLVAVIPELPVSLSTVIFSLARHFLELADTGARSFLRAKPVGAFFFERWSLVLFGY